MPNTRIVRAGSVRLSATVSSRGLFYHNIGAGVRVASRTYMRKSMFIGPTHAEKMALFCASNPHDFGHQALMKTAWRGPRQDSDELIGNARHNTHTSCVQRIDSRPHDR